MVQTVTPSMTLKERLRRALRAHRERLEDEGARLPVLILGQDLRLVAVHNDHIETEYLLASGAYRTKLIALAHLKEVAFDEP